MESNELDKTTADGFYAFMKECDDREWHRIRKISEAPGFFEAYEDITDILPVQDLKEITIKLGMDFNEQNAFREYFYTLFGINHPRKHSMDIRRRESASRRRKRRMRT